MKKAKKVNFFCCMLVYIGKITHNKYAKYDKEIQGCYKEPPQLRPLLARYARLFAPGLHVLSYNEVPDELELKIMGALS